MLQRTIIKLRSWMIGSGEVFPVSRGEAHGSPGLFFKKSVSTPDRQALCRASPGNRINTFHSSNTRETIMSTKLQNTVKTTPSNAAQIAKQKRSDAAKKAAATRKRNQAKQAGKVAQSKVADRSKEKLSYDVKGHEYFRLRSMDIYPGFQKPGSHLIARSCTAAAMVVSGFAAISKSGLCEKRPNGNYSIYKNITQGKVRAKGFDKASMENGSFLVKLQSALNGTHCGRYHGKYDMIKLFMQAMIDGKKITAVDPDAKHGKVSITVEFAPAVTKQL
jgi:hypothetical protein